MNLLVIAMNLATLTYFIGVLVYALPVPYKPMKRWGVRLIIDAISAAVLISSYTIITELGDRILDVLGVSWSIFHRWLTERTTLLVATFSGLTYAATLVKHTAYSFMASPLNLALTYISLALSSIKMIYFLSGFILTYHKELIAIGILLYSIPFRIGKGVGAFLVSAAIIMYIGFPLMPAFVESFQTSIEPNITTEYRIVHGAVTDYYGKALPYAVLKLYSYEIDEEEEIGIISSDSKGRFILGDGFDALPRKFNYSVLVSYMGYVFKPIPLYISDNVDQVNLTVRGITCYSGGVAVLTPYNAVPVVCITGQDGISVTFESVDDEEFEVRILKLQQVGNIELAINGYVANCEWSHLTWYNINISECSVVIYNKYAELEISFEGVEPVKPDIEEKRIFEVESLWDLVFALLSMGLAFIYTLVFMPGLYVAMLLAMSASFARVLGGGVRLKFL
jgi:hypothetical protein